MDKLTVTALPVAVEQKIDRHQIEIGKTVFHVTAGFGKLPLEEILRSRLLATSERKT